MYVDDLLTGGTTLAAAQEKKSKMNKVLSDATFKLHKWNASEKELEEDCNVREDLKTGSQTFAKQQLNIKSSDSNLLRLGWDKESDTLTVTIGSPEIDVESLILMIEHVLVSIIFNLTHATLLSLPNHINITICII